MIHKCKEIPVTTQYSEWGVDDKSSETKWQVVQFGNDILEHGEYYRAIGPIRFCPFCGDDLEDAE